MFKTKIMKQTMTLLSLVAGIGLGSTTANAGLQTVTATVKSTYAQTKYPLLFTHGMFGFSRVKNKRACQRGYTAGNDRLLF